MIHVIATIEVAEGRRGDLLAELEQILPQVRQEAGCLDYGPTCDLATDISAQTPVRPDIVTILERWETLECLEAHLVAPHMVRYRERVKPLVKNVTLQILQPI